jgi:hypothetical protein
MAFFIVNLEAGPTDSEGEKLKDERHVSKRCHEDVRIVRKPTIKCISNFDISWKVEVWNTSRDTRECRKFDKVEDKFERDVKEEGG